MVMEPESHDRLVTPALGQAHCLSHNGTHLSVTWEFSFFLNYCGLGVG